MVTKLQYKAVETTTLAGLKRAERLKARGWKIVQSSLWRIVFRNK